MTPDTHYAKSGDVNIAYQVVGDAPRDLVLVPGWVSNIEVFWEEPACARFLRRLASFARLILFDKRGFEGHHTLVRRELGRFRGREIDTTGDGFLATFDGPARAVGCARAVSDGVRALGLDVRAGLHTGEIELVNDKVSGLAVHIGARVAAAAGPGEILVSSTVKDLVAGSGLRFQDRGSQALKGVPGQWHLFALAPEGRSG
jgi:hypothetical protein